MAAKTYKSRGELNREKKTSPGIALPNIGSTVSSVTSLAANVGTAKVKPISSATSASKSQVGGKKSSGGLKTSTYNGKYSQPDTDNVWISRALELYKEGRKQKEYDSTFSKDFFLKTPEAEELLNVNIENATAMQALQIANTIRQIQAGDNYRTISGDGADYSRGASQYENNDENNRAYQNWMNRFYSTATEEEIGEGLKILQKAIEEAGEYDSDYKTRRQQDYDELKKWAGNTYSSFATMELNDYDTRIAHNNIRIRELGAYNNGLSDSDATAAQTALGLMLSGSGDPIATVQNNKDLRRITDYDNLAKQYSDPHELSDAIIDSLMDFNDRAGSSGHGQESYDEYVRLAEENDSLRRERAEVEERRNSLLEREKYAAMPGTSTSNTSLSHFHPEPYEVATRYSRRNMETGENESFYEYNDPTLAQMVADPEGVWEKYNQAYSEAVATGRTNDFAGDRINDSDLVRRMTQEELDNYKKVYAGYGEEEANKYFDIILRDKLMARQTQQLADEYSANASKNPVSSYLGSFVNNVLGEVGDIANAGRIYLGMEPGQNQFKAVTDAQRGTVNQKLADATEWANFNFLGQEANPFVWLLQGFTAGADEALSSVMFGPGLKNVWMGLTAGSAGVVDNYEKYGDRGNAFLSGLGTAAAEFGSEWLGDKVGGVGIFKNMDNLDSGLKKAGYLAKGTIGEGIEEGLSNVIGTGLDAIAGEFTGVGSEVADRIRYLKANGYTQTEAWNVLAKEYTPEVLQDVIVGAIAGAGMSGSNVAATTAYDNSVNRQLGAEIQQQSNVSAVLSMGLQSEDPGVKRVSEMLMKKLNLTDPNQPILPNDSETNAQLNLVKNSVSEEQQAKDSEKKQANAEARMGEDLEEAVQERKQIRTEEQAASDLNKKQAKEEQRAQADAAKAEQKAAPKEDLNLTRRQKKQVGQVYRKVLNALDVDVEARRKDLRTGIEQKRAELAKNVDERLRRLGERPIKEVSEAIAAVALDDPNLTIDQLDIAEAYAARKGVVKDLWDVYARTVEQRDTYAAATSQKLDAAKMRTADMVSEMKARTGEQTITAAGDISYTTDEGDTITGKLESFASAENGDVAAVVGGKIVPVDRLEIGDEGRDKLLRYAAELRNPGAANAMYEGIEENQDVDAYASGFEAAYHYGEIGIDIAKAKQRATVDMLTPKQFESAYVAGASAAAARPKTVASKVAGKISFADGLDRRLDGLDANQKGAISVMRRFAEVGSVNIEFFESQANAEGSYTEYENGSYNPDTNTIRIDINAGKNKVSDVANYAMLRVASHELTHYIKAQNAEAYQKLQDFVVEHLSALKNTTFDALVELKMQQQPKLSYEAAVEEVVADGSEMMLKNSTVIQQLAIKDKSLFQRVRDWLRDFAKNVQAAFRGVSARSAEARLLQNVKGMQKLWDNALVGAIENVRSAQNSSTPVMDNTPDAVDAIDVGANISFEPSAHIDQRTDESIQTQEPFFNSFDELKDVFAYNMAREIRNDIAKSVPGQKIFNWNSGTSQPEVMAQKRATTDLIAAYKDKYNWTWDSMQNMVDRFIEHCENGTPIPNTLGMKRLEMMIDDALTNGYANMDGTKIAPAVEYLREKGKIEGAIQHNAESDGIPWAEYVFGEGVKFSKRDASDEVKNIKGQIKANADALDAMNPVANVNVQIPSTNNPGAIRKWAIDQLKASGYKVDRKGFGTIEFGEARIKNSLNYLHEKGEIAAITAIPAVLKRGIVAGEHSDHKYRGFPTITFAAPVEINGVRGNMAVVVKQESKNVYKTHRIIMPDGSAFEYNEKAEPSTARGVTGNGSFASPISSAFSDSVAQPTDSVKKSIRAEQTDSPTDRDLLVEAFEGVVQNDNERGYLEKYKGQIEELNEKQIELAKIRREIRDMMFTPGERDSAYKTKLADLKSRANTLAEAINRADKRLLMLENAKPMRDVLARERQKAEKKAAEKRRESLTAMRERRETTEIRHKIRRLADDFNRRLIHPTEKNYIPRDMVHMVIAAQELVDTRGGREGVKAQEKLAQIKAVYDRYKGDSTFSYVYDPMIAEMLQKLSDTAGSKNIYQLNKAELTDIYNTLKALRKQVTEAVKLKAGTYAANIIDAGSEMYRETNEAAPAAKGKLGDYLNWQLTPDKFFARLAGYKKGSVWNGVAKSFSDGTEKMLEIQREAYYHFRKWTESKEFDKLNSVKDNDMIDIGLKDERGNAVKITRGMMLEVYMHLSSEDNMRGFMYGGFSVPNLKKYYAGKVAESYGTGSVNTVGTSMELAELAEQLRDPDLTEAQQAEIQRQMDEAEQRGMDRINAMRATIESKMTAWDRGLIEAVHRWNDGNSRDHINDVTMDLYGIKRAQVENYYPIHRDKAFVNSDFESISRNVNLENWGSLKDRVPSRAPILLGDIAFTLDTSVNQMSRYVGYARAQRDFSKLYNVRMPGMAGSVKKIIGTKFGSGTRSLGVSGEQYIENYIGSITGSRHAESDFLSVIRRNLPRATMTLNARVAFSQLSAIPKAAAEVGWDSVASGLARGGARAIFSKKAREELAQQNAWFWQRYRGEGGQREFADIKGGSGIIDKAWNKMDDLTKGWLLNWCQDFDIMSTVSMWSMAKEWARKHTSFKEGTAEFTEAANRKYTDILRNTQAANTVSERSDLARETKTSLSLLTMYKSEAFANFNMIYDAAARLRKYSQDAKTGKNSVTQADVKQARNQLINSSISVVVGASLTNAILKLAVNALTSSMNNYRDEDDEITLKSTLTAILNEVLNDIASMVTFGGETYDLLIGSKIFGETYYAPSDMALSEIIDTVEYANTVFSKEDATIEDYQKAGSKIFTKVCNMLGVPYNNVKRQAKGLMDTIADIAAGEAFSFEASADRSNGTNYRRMLKASIEGDDTKYASVLAELEENGVELADAQEGYRDMLKEAFEDGEIDRNRAIELMTNYGGKSADDAYWAVDKWEYSDEDSYSKYGDLRAALAAGNRTDAEAAVEELLSHGVKEENLASQISTLYGNGEATSILALQLRPGRLYTPSVKEGQEDKKDDFNAFLDAVLAGKGVEEEISKLRSNGYSTKKMMSALNGAFGKSADRYAIMAKHNPAEAKVLEERILDAYVALGLNREKERTWIHENWTMPEEE